MYYDKTKTKIFTKTNTETITKTHTNIEMSSGEGGFEDNEICKQCGMIAMIIATLQHCNALVDHFCQQLDQQLIDYDGCLGV